MNKFKQIFEFLNLYGKTSFIADPNKPNYNEELYNNIINLKKSSYDEVWKNLFSQISPYLKDKKELYKTQSWQNSGKIYDYFWIQIKDENKLDYTSSVSIVAEKNGIYVKIEYQYTDKNPVNTIVDHNKYILAIDEWKEKYNVNLDKYVIVYKLDSTYEQLPLNSFIENKELKSDIEEKIKNDEPIRIVIQKEFDKDYVLSSNNFELEIAQSINELEFLYKKSIEYVSTSENTIEEFLETQYFGEGGEVVVNKKTTNKSEEEVISHIKSYITSQGYVYDRELISNFYLSLKTKPFVILAGISGTGKSKIVRLFAESLGATTKNNQYNMISVRPDWNDSTELIGYKNLESKFIKGKLTQIIEEASQNLHKPYFVCLDEMNLARVEYYLSDYLSVIESRRKIDHKIITDDLIYDTEISEDNLSLPENLYLIGTVNMDDTTFQFSRKVLDRANTIEFSDVNLENLFVDELHLLSEDTNEELTQGIDIYNDFIKSTYLKTLHIENEYRDYAIEINKKIIEINNILKKSQKQFAYRVRDEILFYMIENKKSHLLNENTAFDYQIMQKVLPAISGSENTVKETLINLFNFVCEKEILKDSDIEEAENYILSSEIKYKRSAEKILYMLKGYNYDGYASYWY